MCGEGETFIECSNQDCGVYGPSDDEDGTKWNAMPRRNNAPTLRDRFAMAALTGLISSGIRIDCVDQAFDFADVCMNRREVKP